MNKTRCQWINRWALAKNSVSQAFLSDLPVITGTTSQHWLYVSCGPRLCERTWFGKIILNPFKISERKFHWHFLWNIQVVFCSDLMHLAWLPPAPSTQRAPCQLPTSPSPAGIRNRPLALGPAVKPEPRHLSLFFREQSLFPWFATSEILSLHLIGGGVENVSPWLCKEVRTDPLFYLMLVNPKVKIFLCFLSPWRSGSRWAGPSWAGAEAVPWKPGGRSPEGQRTGLPGPTCSSAGLSCPLLTQSALRKEII